MVSKRQIESQIGELASLQALTEAYARISSRRMKKTRGAVVSTRSFLAAIDELFQEVRRSYRRKIASLSKKRRTQEGEKITFLAHNAKTVSVLLASNTGLYGEIVKKTFEYFKREVLKSETEVTIIGRLGRAMFLEEFGDRRPYTYFDFPDVGLDKEKLAEIIKHLVPYEEIHLYYGKFYNVIKQEPEMYNISAETALKELETEGQIIKYIFEPSLEKILVFFETEIFGSVFEQSIKESQLAKFASRMLAMDQAYENINERVKNMKLTKLKAVHYALNRKQQSLFSSVHLWKK